MEQRAPHFAPCKTLLVTMTNLLDDSAESRADRELLEALVGLGFSCEAVGRFVVPSDHETDPRSWLAERGWEDTDTPGFPRTGDLTGSSVRAGANGAPVTLYRGATTRPHSPDDAERGAFLQLIGAALRGGHPDVVMVRSGLWMAEILAAARAREIAAVVLQSDCTPRHPAPFQDASVVLTPNQFAATYLREALGLPCAHLPPVVARGTGTNPQSAGAVVFDATAAGSGLAVFAQIATEMGARRPDLPIIVIGADGSLPMPRGGRVECVSRFDAAPVWASARVCLAPQISWEHLPRATLTALAHGVPVVASDRGAAAELLGGAATTLPLPPRVTTGFAPQLRAEEITPWADAVLRFFDDPVFASDQSAAAARAAEQLSAGELAPRYARFLAELAGERPQPKFSANGFSTNGAGHDDGAALQQFTESHPWPSEQPQDAAPGQEQGWLGAGSEAMLARSLSPKTKLVVELGSWLGLSTRFIADHAPRATVVSVDTWEGSTEHKTQERYQTLLPRLFETFQARCWNYRDRVTPLRTTSLDGLQCVADAGLEPDLVYVDAEHTYEAVSAELRLARKLFPRSLLCGDDYDWSGVRRAVDEFAAGAGLVVDRTGARGWRLLEGWRAGDASQPPPGRGQSVVLVPHLNGIEWECEQALRQLESAGVRVVRRGGCSAIDSARNELVSDALHDGAESLLFIDSDIGFDPADALRLLARPEPVASGVYAKKGMRELASIFADGVKELVFGPDAVGTYPLKYAATGFLRLRASVLRKMIADLNMPLCNTHWGRGVWPFFQPLIIPHGPGKWHYLGEDWSFSYRLAQIGVTPVADTSIRLWHWGRYGFGWEDAGRTVERYRSYTYHLAVP
jgi:hypothetical protein